MQKWNKILFIATMAAVLAACKEKAPAVATNETATNTSFTTGIALQPALADIDSIDVLFYKDPFGKDGKRYTRFYTSYQTTSDTLIGLIKLNMARPFKEDSLRDCRSEGKIFCFSKGKVVQTIYFTHQNASCSHLYFIHTARFYYFEPTDALIERLFALKDSAR